METVHQSGADALAQNNMAEENTAIGAFAVSSNTEGDFNTATGAFALYFNTKRCKERR